MNHANPPPQALLSIWDKTGIVELATELSTLGFELISTGGTARVLRNAGLPVRSVSDVTQHPEIFDGRVKSLHPAIHGSLLARLHLEQDVDELSKLGYGRIALVACNLYPFADATLKSPPLEDDALLEMIDIGGPTMVRASAKNHRHVLVTTNPDRYTDIVEALKAAGDVDRVDMDLRRLLALEAFEHTAMYDSIIAAELHRRYVGDPTAHKGAEEQQPFLPNQVLSGYTARRPLRYGENAHQSAALYTSPSNMNGHGTLVTAKVEGGKAMSTTIIRTPMQRCGFAVHYRLTNGQKLPTPVSL